MLTLYLAFAASSCTIEKPICMKPSIVRTQPKPQSPIPKHCAKVS